MTHIITDRGFKTCPGGRPTVATVEEQLHAFRPDIPTPHWEAIRTFVVEHVAALRTRKGAETNTALSVAAHYAHWIWQTAGLPLDGEVFSSQLVELYVARAMTEKSDESVRKVRWQLARLGAELGADEVRPLRRRATKQHRYTPYTEREQERLRAWAYQQSPSIRRQNASVLIGLAGGAGLAVQDLQTLLVRDVRVEVERTIVTITGQRSRIVDVDADWAYLLRPALDNLAPGDFIFRPGRHSTTNRGLASPVLESCSTPPVPVNTQRLRNTWLLRHLVEDGDVREFMKSAAVGVDAVSDLMPFAIADDPDALRRRVANQLKGWRANTRKGAV